MMNKIFAFSVLLLFIGCKSSKNKIDSFSDGEDSTLKLERLFSRGGDITLPAGKIYINKPLKITKRGTNLTGVSMDSTTIQFAPGVGIDIMASDVMISDLHLSGTYKPDKAEQHTLNVRGPYTRVKFHRVKVTDGDDTGIRIGYALRRGRRAPAFDCEIVDCVIEDIREGSGIEVMSASGVLIAGNKVSGTYQNGIRLAGGKECVVRNNEIRDFNLQGVRYAYGIYAKGGKSKAAHDYVRDILIEENFISGSAKNISVGTQTENVEIVNNRIMVQDSISGIGITLENNLNGAAYGYRNIEIRDNHIFGNLKSGIELHTRDNDPAVSGEKVYIENNTIDNYSSHAISIRGNNFGEVRHIYVNENNFKENLNAITKEAIVISKCKEIFVKDNVISISNRKKDIMLRKGSTINKEH